MKHLSDILTGVEVIQLIGNSDCMVEAITFDSRKVTASTLFVAVSGTHADGHGYISQAVDKGAIVVVCENRPEVLSGNVCYIKVANSELALAVIASNFYDNPSQKLRLVGVTGTNGKTTTATLLYRVFRKMGRKAGLLSTVKYFVNDQEFEATHTTPDALRINSLLNLMVTEGCEYCFMEVSSHSIVQQRIANLRFAGAIFSNITQDHLDYHKTFDEYIKAKKIFFDMLPKEAFALVNADDKHGRVMLQNTKATQYTYALKSFANFKGRVLESHFEGMKLEFDGIELWTRLIGEFNAYNLLAIYATLVLLGNEKIESLEILSNIDAVDGRFQTLRSHNGITAIIDYAHTPDALVNVLKTISKIRTGQETVITVAGAGGDRDKTKRPIMGQIVAEMSDKAILTSDNPRTEKPEEIINDIYQGVAQKDQKKVLIIADRREAIRTACMMAKSGDIILVAGKGHEDYQEINGVKHHFNDREIVTEYFAILSQ